MNVLIQFPIYISGIYFYGSLIFNIPIDMVAYFPYASASHLIMLVSIFQNSMFPVITLKHMILSIRSLLCSSHFIYHKPSYYNYLTCIGAMIINDIIDYFYKPETIYHEDIISHIDYMEYIITYFMFENIYCAYIPIFTYQLSTILLNKINNNQINHNQYNVYYHWLLNSNTLAFLKTNYLFAPFSYCSAWYIYQMHKVNKENKYICWTIIFIMNLLIKDGIERIKVVPDDFYLYPLGYVILFYVYQHLNYVGIWSKLFFE